METTEKKCGEIEIRTATELEQERVHTCRARQRLNSEEGAEWQKNDTAVHTAVSRVQLSSGRSPVEWSPADTNTTVQTVVSKEERIRDRRDATVQTIAPGISKQANDKVQTPTNSRANQVFQLSDYLFHLGSAVCTAWVYFLTHNLHRPVVCTAGHIMGVLRGLYCWAYLLTHNLHRPAYYGSAPRSVLLSLPFDS